jgi:hypothetical protein
MPERVGGSPNVVEAAEISSGQRGQSSWQIGE